MESTNPRQRRGAVAGRYVPKMDLGRVELPTSRLSGEAQRKESPRRSRSFIEGRPPIHRLSAAPISDFPVLNGHHNTHHHEDLSAEIFTDLEAPAPCDCGARMEWVDCEACSARDVSRCPECGGGRGWFDCLRCREGHPSDYTRRASDPPRRVRGNPPRCGKP